MTPNRITRKMSQASRRPETGRQRLAVVIPYLWLGAFLLVPFLIVLKISLSQTALAQPPYIPVFDLAEGLDGIKDAPIVGRNNDSIHKTGFSHTSVNVLYQRFSFDFS